MTLIVDDTILLDSLIHIVVVVVYVNENSSLQPRTLSFRLMIDRINPDISFVPT